MRENEIESRTFSYRHHWNERKQKKNVLMSTGHAIRIVHEEKQDKKYAKNDSQFRKVSHFFFYDEETEQMYVRIKEWKRAR